jgi:hypothetical protein
MYENVGKNDIKKVIKHMKRSSRHLRYSRGDIGVVEGISARAG